MGDVERGGRGWWEGGETGCSAWMRAKMYFFVFFFFLLSLYLPFERTVVGWITNPELPPARSSLCRARRALDVRARRAGSLPDIAL